MARHFGEIEAGDSRCIAKRLTVVTHELGHDRERVGLNDEFAVICAETLRDQARVGELVECVVAEADRESLDRLRRLLGHCSDNRT